MLWQRSRAYAQDLRERVFAASDANLPIGRIAAMLFVSVSYVSKVLGRRRKTGETTARPQRCHVPRELTEQFDAIRAQVATHLDATLEDLRAWLKETHQVTASVTPEIAPKLATYCFPFNAGMCPCQPCPLMRKIRMFRYFWPDSS